MDECEIERGVMTETMLMASRLGEIQRQFETRAIRPSLACEDCGDPIPLGRREALPNARRCVDCQGNSERRW